MSLNSLRYGFRHTGKWILGIVTVAMLVTAYTGIGMALNSRTRNIAASPQQSANTPVATVNGEPITRQEYDMAYAMATEQMKQQAQMYGQSISPLQGGQTRMQALTQTVNQTLAEQIAKQAGVTVTDADVQKARDTQVTQLKTQLGLKPDASIDDVNQALGGGRTVDQIFPDSLFRKQVAIQHYQDMLKRSVVATDQAVQEYYRQVHTRHILIGNKSRPDAQAKALAQDLINKIKGGADFAALAKQYSDDPGSKNKGGDDGFIGEQTGYVPEFIKASLGLQPGQTTQEPVLSPQYGYFIIQALATKENLPADFAKNKAKYQQQVAQSLQTQTEQQAYEAASKNEKVVVNDPLLRAYRALQMPAPGSTPGPTPAVIADFQKALTTADYTTKGEIEAQLAQIYQQQGKMQDEIAALTQALTSVEDPQLRLMLGDAYRKSGDTAKALEQYKMASSNAYDNPGVHVQLQQIYKQMNQPQLIATETDWMKAYSKSHQQPQMPFGAGGRTPISVTPNAAPVAVKK